MKTNLFKISVLLVVSVGIIQCGTATESSDLPDDVVSAIGSLFGSTDAQALKAQGGEEFTFDPCGDMCSGGNISCDPSVAAGDYGPTSGGRSVTEGFTCDSTTAGMGCQTWTMTADVTMVCPTASIIFGQGSTGMICQSMTGTAVEGIVDGTFIIESIPVKCHMEFSSSGQNSQDMSGFCEDPTTGETFTPTVSAECTGPD